MKYDCAERRNAGCEEVGHCECWYDGGTCCYCHCWDDDYFSDVPMRDEIIWDEDDDGSDENKDDE